MDPCIWLKRVENRILTSSSGIISSSPIHQKHIKQIDKFTFANRLSSRKQDKYIASGQTCGTHQTVSHVSRQHCTAQETSFHTNLSLSYLSKNELKIKQVKMIQISCYKNVNHDLQSQFKRYYRIIIELTFNYRINFKKTQLIIELTLRNTPSNQHTIGTHQEIKVLDLRILLHCLVAV